MAAVQEEKKLNSQTEDVRDMIELLKQLTSEERREVKGIMIGIRMFKTLETKTA